MSILLDTSYFLALLNESDVHHDEAKSVAVMIDSEKYGVVFTTDHILDEVISVTLRKFGKEKAIYAGRYVLNKTNTIISDEHLIVASWKLFEKTRLNLSFTDCSLIVVSKAFGMEQIATFDKEFKKAGVKVID